MSKSLDKSVGLFSFLALPILALILAIKNYRMPWSKNVVWAFMAFYAYHFSSPNEGADIKHYIEKFINYSFIDFSIQDFIISQYSEGSTTLDILEPLTSYLLSRITDNYHFLLLIYGVIYGYFFSRNIYYFIDSTKEKLSSKSLAVLTLLIIVIGIWNINGFRFWCAAQIFIYACFNLIIYKKIKGYLFLVLACLMHLGLLIPSLILLLFKLIKLPVHIVFGVFLVTFFLAELDMEVVRTSINNYAPDFVKNKLNAYTSEAYVEVVSEKLESYSVFYQLSKFIRIGLVVFFSSFLLINKKLFQKDKFYQLFVFFLTFGSFANILSQMPSGGRYLVITDFILFGITFYFIQNYRHAILSKYINYTIPIILVYGFYNFRIIGIHTFNIHHFINNPIVSLFIY